MTPLTTSTSAGLDIASKQSPYAEIDYKTSGGHDSYNAMQLALNKRSASGLALNAQYTLGYSKGNTGGSNEAIDGRQQRARASPTSTTTTATTTSTSATRSTSARSTRCPARARGRAAGNVGGIFNGRSGLPVPVLIQRNDIVYVDARGQRVQQRRRRIARPVDQHAWRRRVAQHAPADLVPGVDPFVKDGGLLFLNPAAFATPKPGTFGNLERNPIHGPWIPPGRSGRVEADSDGSGAATSSCGRSSSTSSTSRTSRNAGRHAAERAAERRADRGRTRCSRDSRTPRAPPARSVG